MSDTATRAAELEEMIGSLFSVLFPDCTETDAERALETIGNELQGLRRHAAAMERLIHPLREKEHRYREELRADGFDVAVYRGADVVALRGIQLFPREREEVARG